jgi:hypothetical protein
MRLKNKNKLYSLSNITFNQYFHKAIFNYNLLMSVIEKLLSEKGKPMVVHAGHIYTQERTTLTKLIFRCKDRNCKGN